MNKPLIYLLLLFVASSCVTNKQLTYFQGKPNQIKELSKLNNQPYRLQVNDILSIDLKADNPKMVSMFKNSASEMAVSNTGSDQLYFKGYSVNRQGNIRIPYIGEVNVLGFTTKEVREKIESDLKKYFKNPEQIFVTVKLAGIRFVVTGEVGSPGTINLMQNQVSVIDAIANAGEITNLGDRENVYIIRKSLGNVQKFKINLTSIDVFNSPNFYIQPNDVIYVPPLKQKSWGTGTTGFQSFSTIVTILSFIVSSVLLVKNL